MTSGDKIRIYLHSDIIPENAGAGELVLYRHFHEYNEFEILHSHQPCQQAFTQSKIWNRLKSTRFYETSLTADTLVHAGSPAANVVEHAKNFSAQLILTVAHGWKHLEAVKLGRILQLPVAVIYHDWWPDLISHSAFNQNILERRFRKTHKKCDLAFPVCEGMQRHLGMHSNSVILPPMPNSVRESCSPVEDGGLSTLFRVCYSGNLFHYGPMLGDLLVCLKDTLACRLTVRGAAPNWPESFAKEMACTGNYLPPASLSEYSSWATGFDAHLCVMQFDQSARRRMETSFPSKMLESFVMGKPVIVWGPEYCSAIQWAKGKNAVLAITDPSPQVVAHEIQLLADDKQEQQRLTQRSRELASSEFDPNRIQNRFVSAIRSLVER